MIAEWKVGMTKEEALAITTHGVPVKAGQSASGSDPSNRVIESEVFKVPDSITYLGQQGQISFTVRDEKVAGLGFIVMIPDYTLESRANAYRFAGEAAGLLEFKDREEFVTRAKSGIDEICDLGRPSAQAVSPEDPTVVMSFRVVANRGFACHLVVDPGLGSGYQLIEGGITVRTGRSFPMGPMGPMGPGNRTGTPAKVPAFNSTNSYQVNGADGKKFNRSLGTINALLVRPLEDGKNAASAMKLTVTAIGERTDGVVDFGFNQEVGEDMQRANQEVVRAVMLRNGGFPANMNVRFGFADKWGGKDGPSAAVACALLLESLIHGFEIPAQLAVTGDLNADSTVQPVGGVADKIRGAMDANCSLIGIPASNEEDVTDLVVEENLRRFLTAKVFTLEKLDDALLLADPSRMSDDVRKAFTDLDAVQKELAVQGAALFSPEMQQRLTSIQTALPNCYTAKILAAAGRRTLPVRYSLVGSLMRIDEAMAPFAGFLAKVKEEKSIDEFRLTRDNPMQLAKNRLNALRSKSDERLIAVIDAQKAVVDQFQRFVSADIGSTSVFDSHIKELEKVDSRAAEAWKQVRDNREIQDQFMKRGISL
ncbi:MAG: S16 family serine protease [Verrucomicrobiales bacterium]